MIVRETFECVENYLFVLVSHSTGSKVWSKWKENGTFFTWRNKVVKVLNGKSFSYQKYFWGHERVLPNDKLQNYKIDVLKMGKWCVNCVQWCTSKISCRSVVQLYCRNTSLTHPLHITFTSLALIQHFYITNTPRIHQLTIFSTSILWFCRLSFFKTLAIS